MECVRCLFSDAVPSITFSEDGQCSYCDQFDAMNTKWPGGFDGHAKLLQIVREVRCAGKKKEYDCVVGVSGGSDSSYMLYKLKEIYKLRPLAVHFDNTWNSKVATQNIFQMCKELDIELETLVVDNKEFEGMQKAFLEAGSVDIETPSDIGLAATLYRVAHKHKIKYIFEGHNFRTEGSWPLGWLYMDQCYIDSICKEYGRWPLKTFPTMHMHDMFHWMAWHGIKKIRPWWYWDTPKETVIKFLEQKFGWTWYGGHHLENRFTAFYHSWFMPGRFGLDTRVNGFSALIRSGQLTRKGAVEIMKCPPYMEGLLEHKVISRLGYKRGEFGRILLLPRKTFRDFKTYKKWFEFLRPLFWILMKLDRIPFTFYAKYTKRHEGYWDPETEAQMRESGIDYENLPTMSSNPDGVMEARDDV